MAFSCQNIFVITHFSMILCFLRHLHLITSCELSTVCTAPYRPSPVPDVRIISGNRPRSHLDQPLAGENLISRCMLFSLNHLPGYHSNSHFSWLYFQDLPKEWEKRFISFWPQLLSRASPKASCSINSSSGSLPCLHSSRAVATGLQKAT